MPLRTSLYRKPSSSSARWPSRRRREVLSVNMISLPLADFRHLSHIGNDAHTDSFGDLSFLKMGHNLLMQSSQSEQNLLLACSPPPKPPRLNLDEQSEHSDSPDWNKARRDVPLQNTKKCNSMPILDDSEGEREVEKEDSVAIGQTRGPGRHGSSSDKDRVSAETRDKTAAQQADEDSGFSFSLDLGPSILDDVLQVMEKLHK